MIFITERVESARLNFASRNDAISKREREREILRILAHSREREERERETPAPKEPARLLPGPHAS